jgi:thioredoxin 1
MFLRKVKAMLVTTRCIGLTDDNFTFEVLETPTPVLVDCWASWCGSCQPMNPIFEELAIEFGEQIMVGRLNVATSKRLTALYSIRAVPTLLLFQNGQVIERVIGSPAKQYLTNKLNALLASSHSSRSRMACL